jgi:tripartite-type tricarboxylate transporter receptor subunit TctC
MKLLIFLFLLSIQISHAQNVIYVPYAAGGWSDTIARLISKYEKNSIVINQNQGRSIQQFDQAVKKRYLISMGMSFAITDPLLYSDEKSFNFSERFDLMVLGSSPNILFAHSFLEIKTVHELIKIMQGKELLYSTSGSFNHIGILEFLETASVRARPIPYNGGAQSVLSVLSKQTDFSMTNLTGISPLLNNKNVKILAVNSQHKFAQLQGVPTFKETFGREMKTTAYALFAIPKNMSQVEKSYWVNFINRISKDEDFAADTERAGLIMNLLNINQFNLWHSEQMEFYGKIIKNHMVIRN